MNLDYGDADNNMAAMDDTTLDLSALFKDLNLLEEPLYFMEDKIKGTPKTLTPQTIPIKITDLYQLLLLVQKNCRENDIILSDNLTKMAAAVTNSVTTAIVKADDCFLKADEAVLEVQRLAGILDDMREEMEGFRRVAVNHKQAIDILKTDL